MSDELNCPVDGDVLVDHEAYRGGAAPKVVVKNKLRGLFGLSPCAVPGVSLTNYNIDAQGKGWGAHCTGGHTTVSLSTGAKATVRSEIAELTKLVLEEVIRRGYFIRPADTGAYNCRYISGTTVWSNHAWGLAIDINWQSNPYTSPRRTDMPSWMPALLNRYGFAWGGDYTGSQDSMHYEFMGTPAQAVAATNLARTELTGVAPPPPPVVVVPPVSGYRPINLGDATELNTSGEQVRRDQNDLNDTGFTCTVDGYAGPSTVTRITDFQYAAGLPLDGSMGPRTRDAIHKVPSWNNAVPNGGGYSGLRWQQELKAHGWNIETDGFFGDHSVAILKQFQADKHIDVNGLANYQTWAALHTQPN